MRAIVHILLFFLGISVAVAQQDDGYKAFLKSSSVAIHKAQKEMISANKTDEGGLLAKAVILQNNALMLYKLNSNKAMCISALAKTYAATIIKNLNEVEAQDYLVQDDEKKLLGNCAGDNELYNESKHAANNPSELDKDYLGSFNNLIVDVNLR